MGAIGLLLLGLFLYGLSTLIPYNMTENTEISDGFTSGFSTINEVRANRIFGKRLKKSLDDSATEETCEEIEYSDVATENSEPIKDMTSEVPQQQANDLNDIQEVIKTERTGNSEAKQTNGFSIKEASGAKTETTPPPSSTWNSDTTVSLSVVTDDKAMTDEQETRSFEERLDSFLKEFFDDSPSNINSKQIAVNNMKDTIKENDEAFKTEFEKDKKSVSKIKKVNDERFSPHIGFSANEKHKSVEDGLSSEKVIENIFKDNTKSILSETMHVEKGNDTSKVNIEKIDDNHITHDGISDAKNQHVGGVTEKSDPLTDTTESTTRIESILSAILKVLEEEFEGETVNPNVFKETERIDDDKAVRKPSSGSNIHQNYKLHSEVNQESKSNEKEQIESESNIVNQVANDYREINLGGKFKIMAKGNIDQPNENKSEMYTVNKKKTVSDKKRPVTKLESVTTSKKQETTHTPNEREPFKKIDESNKDVVKEERLGHIQITSSPFHTNKVVTEQQNTNTIQDSVEKDNKKITEKGMPSETPIDTSRGYSASTNHVNIHTIETKAAVTINEENDVTIPHTENKAANDFETTKRQKDSFTTKKHESHVSDGGILNDENVPVDDVTVTENANKKEMQAEDDSGAHAQDEAKTSPQISDKLHNPQEQKSSILKRAIRWISKVL